MYSCTRGTLGMSPAQLAGALWGTVMGNVQTGRIFVFDLRTSPWTFGDLPRQSTAPKLPLENHPEGGCGRCGGTKSGWREGPFWTNFRVLAPKSSFLASRVPENDPQPPNYPYRVI